MIDELSLRHTVPTDHGSYQDIPIRLSSLNISNSLAPVGSVSTCSPCQENSVPSSMWKVSGRQPTFFGKSVFRCLGFCSATFFLTHSSTADMGQGRPQGATVELPSPRSSSHWPRPLQVTPGAAVASIFKGSRSFTVNRRGNSSSSAQICYSLSRDTWPPMMGGPVDLGQCCHNYPDTHVVDCPPFLL